MGARQVFEQQSKFELVRAEAKEGGQRRRSSPPLPFLLAQELRVLEEQQKQVAQKHANMLEEQQRVRQAEVEKKRRLADEWARQRMSSPSPAKEIESFDRIISSHFTTTPVKSEQLA